jgi:hypothetical protein
MTSRLTRSFIFTLAMTAGFSLFSACGSEVGPPRARVPEGNAPRPELTPPTTDISESENPTPPPLEPAPSEPTDSESTAGNVFDRFCEASGKLSLTRKFFHGDWSFLCDAEGHARPFLMETLKSAAFNGSGSPQLFDLPLEDERVGITAGRYAGAVALVGSAQSLFQGLLPLQTDWDKMKSMGVALVDGVIDEKVLSILPNTVDSLKGSWSKLAKVKKKIGIIPAEGAFEFRSDFFELVPGQVYLATLLLTKEISNIANAKYYTLMIQDGNLAWVFSITMLAMDNWGLGQGPISNVIRDTVSNTFRNVRKSSQILLSGSAIAPRKLFGEFL